jgi:hypothetical protein
MEDKNEPSIFHYFLFILIPIGNLMLLGGTIVWNPFRRILEKARYSGIPLNVRLWLEGGLSWLYILLFFAGIAVLFFPINPNRRLVLAFLFPFLAMLLNLL